MIKSLKGSQGALGDQSSLIEDRHSPLGSQKTNFFDLSTSSNIRFLLITFKNQQKWCRSPTVSALGRSLCPKKIKWTPRWDQKDDILGQQKNAIWPTRGSFAA
jgi:hypothetical protein